MLVHHINIHIYVGSSITWYEMLLDIWKLCTRLTCSNNCGFWWLTHVVGWGGSYSFREVGYLYDIRDILEFDLWSLISDDTFLAWDSHGDGYSLLIWYWKSILRLSRATFFWINLEILFQRYSMVGLREIIPFLGNSTSLYSKFAHPPLGDWKNISSPSQC